MRIAVGHVERPAEAVLFDKDGTIIDFDHMWGLWTETLIDRLSSAHPDIDWRDVTGMRRHNGRWKHDPKGPAVMGSTAENRGLLAWQIYRKHIPWNEAVRQVTACVKEANVVLERHKPARALPGLPEFLEQCSRHGIKLAVVTADDTEAAERHLEWLGIRDRFAAVIGSDRVAHGKPHPEMAELALALLGVDRDAAVLFGDSAGDMEMARACGLAGAFGIAQDPEAAKALQPIADAVIPDYFGVRIIGGDSGNEAD
jgi:haloacid dehalogenase superfamily, subfamily IA, variant 3 with third motif having DD or ED/haloacid dehalogenase superfamily, subfamily IA, variant 1 with third motif having Dx(3-4)D or Dx(3-4)E